MVRSFGGALVALGLWAGAQLTFAVAACPQHRAWMRLRADDSAAVAGAGERIARPGEAIFVCETPHAIGPVVLHQDADCYCAPDGATPAQVSAWVGGSCRLDTRHPRFDAATGGCRFGRCNHDVGAH